MSAPLAAVAGATGFVGRHVVEALHARGWRVRVLARRDPIHPLWRDLQPELVLGDLRDPAASSRLVRGAEAVINAAGLVKAADAATFQAINVEACARLAAAARAHAPGAAFVLVSSLAAREPQLSAYACSKRNGELAAHQALGAAAQVVRPCAVYGPGDRETLHLFRAAAASPVLPLLDPAARTSLIHVADVARAVAVCAGRRAGPALTLADARDGGYSWREIMTAAARAVGAEPRLARAPAWALKAIGLAGDLGWRLGAHPMLTSGKARELLHGDWGVREPERGADAPTPAFDLAAGFAHTVAWYRGAGWLPPGRSVA